MGKLSKLSFEFSEVTADLRDARTELGDLEQARMSVKSLLDAAEAALDEAKIRAMASDEAGPNEAKRKAYALEATVVERDAVATFRDMLTKIEIDIVSAAVVLRVAEDQRRFLEALTKINEIERSDPAVGAQVLWSTQGGVPVLVG